MAKGFAFISNIDLFGAEVGLKYEGRNKYTSRVGGFATLIVGGLLSALFYQQFFQILNHVNPNVIQQQSYVDLPARYNLTKDQFSFMIGLLDQNQNPFVDESIFTIEAEFQYKIDMFQNGTLIQKLVSIQIPTGPCTQDDFEIMDIKSYFTSQPFEQYICLKNQNDLFLEGQFDQKKFSVLMFKIVECIDKPICKPAETRQQIIKTSKAQIFYTDRIVESYDFYKPFKSIGKTQYYNIFYEYLVKSSFIFSNTVIQDDIGLFIQSLSTKTQLQFVTDSQSLQSKTANVFFKVSIFLDKNKENSYFRTYKKIPEALSQLGGTFQVLFFIGCLFIKPYNFLKLKNRLHKDIFSEDNQNLNKKKSSQKKKQQRSNSIFNKKTQNPPTINVYNNTNTDQIQEEEKPIKEKQRFSFLRKIHEFFGKVSQQVKQQYQDIENMRSIKTIINTQIQFILLQKLFYQIDFSKIKLISNQPSLLFDSRSKILLESSFKDNSFQSFNFQKFQLKLSSNNQEVQNFNNSITKNQNVCDVSCSSPIKIQPDKNKLIIDKQNSPDEQKKQQSESDDYRHSYTSKQNIKASQIQNQQQENQKSDIDIESESVYVNYIQGQSFNTILNLNKFQQLNPNQIKNQNVNNQMINV